MSDFIKHIYISNFKSIKSCEIDECKRINLFIGRPNVGKSNILEALSILSLPYLKEHKSWKISNIIRLEHEVELFNNGYVEEGASIRTNNAECYLTYSPTSGLKIRLRFGEFVDEPDIFGDQMSPIIYGGFNIEVDEKLFTKWRFFDKSFQPPIKRYVFKQDVKYTKGHAKYLIPPFGTNLLSIIQSYPDLRLEVESFFKDYDLEIAFDKASQTIKIIQINKDGIFLIPYNSIADTLQRIIFYKAAIASNTNSILLFEEPEAHSFPPYMSHLTQEMIHKKDNQFFLATHSPFILNDLLENGMDELAVFIVDYKDGQTVVNGLSREELHRVAQNGIDLFVNNESFF